MFTYGSYIYPARLILIAAYSSEIVYKCIYHGEAVYIYPDRLIIIVVIIMLHTYIPACSASSEENSHYM